MDTDQQPEEGEALTQTDTKEQILDAAERLFADRGFDATSLRTITSEADVNLAAVHYHYGSKEALIEAVLCRRLEGLNHERLERLEACERAAGEAPPPLECLIQAFVEPPLRLSRDPARGGERFMRLMGSAYWLPGDYLFRLFRTRFGEFVARFTTGLSRILPELSREEIHWSLHFMIGTMAHTMATAQKLEQMSDGVVHASDTDAIIQRLVTFNAAGMRALVEKSKGGVTS
jgi:AcrR family transcriptional regulator